MKRKNKKGFTLIELLAIIVILAIIAVITVPLILNIINDAKQNASIDSAYGYKSALEKYYMKKVVENTENELPNGYKNISELPEDFIVSGEAPSEGWVKLNKGIIEEYSLKYDEYVVTMDNEKNIISERSNKVISFIPDTYQKVEYLESTGTQYIKTTTNVLETDYIETEFSMPYVANQIDKYMVSTQTWNVSANSRFSMGVHTKGGAGSTFCAGFGGQTTSNTILNPNTVNDSEFHKWTYNNKVFKIDDLNLTFNGSNIEYAKNPQNTVYLFYGYNATTIGKMKKYIQKRNNDPILYLVPVIRKSDNKPGMLDLATRTNNLFNKEALSYNEGYIKQDGTLYSMGNNTMWVVSDYIPVSSGKSYIASNLSRGGSGTYCAIYDEEKNFVRSLSITANQNVVFNIANGEKYIRLSVRKIDNEIQTTMLNEGSTALPYEPYGYKFYTNAGTDEFITGPEI